MGRGGGGQAGEKNKETVTASLCLVFNGCGGILAPPLIKQSPPLAKKPVKSGKYDQTIACCYAVVNFETF